MITERKRIADKYRSEGQGEASKIIGDKERDLKQIQSEAYRQAQTIIGKADAEATANTAEANAQVVAVRKAAYGSIESQIEFITENGLDAWTAKVAQIKADNPKI